MIKITILVDRDKAVDAMVTAYDYAHNYQSTRKPSLPMTLTNHGNKYSVHHTKSGSVVIKQK